MSYTSLNWGWQRYVDREILGEYTMYHISLSRSTESETSILLAGKCMAHEEAPVYFSEITLLIGPVVAGKDKTSSGQRFSSFTVH